MIKVNTLINLLKKNNTNFFTGVPDSVLKELSSYLKIKLIQNKINLRFLQKKLKKYVIPDNHKISWL